MSDNKPEANHAPAYIAGLVAVVGCDGTGKSTLTAELVKTMKMRWVTERRYLGLVSGEDGDKIKRLPVIGVWLERRLAARSSKTQSMSTQALPWWAALIMYGFSLRRMAHLRQVMRLARDGVMVISDRFPQAEISGFHYDGPGIGVERVKGRLMRRLAKRERRLYQRMSRYRPELVIRLNIDIDTAFSRKPDHDYQELRDKIAVMGKINYNHANVLEINSREPYCDVLEKALNAVSAVAESSHRKIISG